MKRVLVPLLLMLALTAARAASPVTAADLQAWLAEARPPLLVDLRTPQEYAAAHLPGAINIPWTVMDSRRLPPVGRVVAYGGGLGREDLEAALQALDAKPGIEAWYLEGGLAAWEARAGMLAGEAGVQREQTQYITYQQALRMLPRDALLVDMRAQPAGDGETALPASGGEDPVGDFARGVGRPLLKGLPPPAAEGLASPAGEPATPPLFVLIDDDPARAIESARRLRDQGHTRVVILAGGVEVIQFKGQYGLERVATGITVEELPNE